MEILESRLWVPAIISVIGVGAVIAADYIRGCRLAKQARDLDRKGRETSEAGDKAISGLNELTAYFKIRRINSGLTNYKI